MTQESNKVVKMPEYFLQKLEAEGKLSPELQEKLLALIPYFIENGGEITKQYISVLEQELEKERKDVQGLEERATALHNEMTSLKGKSTNLEQLFLDHSQKNMLLTTQNEDYLKDIGSLKTELDHDDITHGYNRRFMLKQLQREIENAEKYRNYSFVLGILDLDKFKLFNDKKGHLAGDKLLKQVYELIKDELPQDCVVGRWYRGDEFAIAVPIVNTRDNAAVSEAYAVFEKIRTAIENHSKEHILKRFAVTSTIGYATYDPKRHVELDDLVKEADKWLQNGKATRNIVKGDRAIYSTYRKPEKQYLRIATNVLKAIPNGFKGFYNGFRNTFYRS